MAEIIIPQVVRLNLGDPTTWIFVGAATLVTCLLAGWYPARAISSFLPVISLRGSGIRQLNTKSYLRKSLIVFQFSVSLLFIIGTIMVGRLIHYMLNTDLGFKKNAIVMIDLPWRAPQNLKAVYAGEIERLAGAGWAAHRWLADFAYRTSMPWWIFVLAGIAALAIALVTISFQTIRAATANPVRSLKVE